MILPLLGACTTLAPTGCKSASLAEITGKSSFGPDFRNLGDNTHDIKYTAIQSLEFKLANKWTLGVTYQRKDMDEGAGDNENLVLFEVGYPLWNAPKPEKTAEDVQIETLEKQLRGLNSELAEIVPAWEEPPTQLVQGSAAAESGTSERKIE